jgi:ferredoxin-NADP reductase
MRVRSISDVTPHMREVELTGPEAPRLRFRPGAHLVLPMWDRQQYLASPRSRRLNRR